MLIQENLGLSPWRNFSLPVHKKVDFSFHLRVVQFQWAFILQPPPLNSGLFVMTFQLDVFYDLFIRKDTLQRSKSLACSAFSNHNSASKKPVVRHIGFSKRASDYACHHCSLACHFSMQAQHCRGKMVVREFLFCYKFVRIFVIFFCKVFYYLVDD